MNSAELLIEALPYIRKFHGSKIVIKCGGHAAINDETIDSIVKDLILLRYVGIQPVLVHGGGPEISRVMEKMGIKPKIVNGLRVTDEKTMEVARMVLIGDVGAKIVSKISSHGGKAIGLSGKDGKLFTACKKESQKVTIEGVEKNIDLGYVGEIEKVDPEMIEIVSERGYIPVISPIAIDDQGNSLNVNADTVAGEVASNIEARKIIMMTNVDGILRDREEDKSLISKLSIEEAQKLLNDGTVKRGMIPKTKASIKAVRSGVKKAHIINAERPHSLILELFTDEGVGTMITES